MRKVKLTVIKTPLNKWAVVRLIEDDERLSLDCCGSYRLHKEANERKTLLAYVMNLSIKKLEQLKKEASHVSR